MIVPQGIRIALRSFGLIAVALESVALGLPGGLDNRFASGGTFIGLPGGAVDGEVRAISIRSDGKIIGVGPLYLSSLGRFGFGLMQLKADGNLDPTFGTNGVVATHWDEDAIPTALSVRLDGKIIVAGRGLDDARGRLVQYSSTGTVDIGFGNQGVVLLAPESGGPNGLEVDPDGKIVVGFPRGGGEGPKFTLRRYLENGTVDTSFGSAGITSIELIESPGSATLAAIRRDESGRLIAAGCASTPSQDISGWVVARWLPDGAIDTTFGTNGFVLSSHAPDEGGCATGLRIQTDGKYVVGGWVINTQGSRFRVARYMHDGTIDSAFGSGGAVATRVNSDYDYATDVAVQTNGKIVIGGYSQDSKATVDYFALVRYRTDGSLDSAFGADGIVLTPIGQINAIELQPDGKILAAGNGLRPDFSVGFALARYRGDSTGVLPGTRLSMRVGPPRGNHLKVVSTDPRLNLECTNPAECDPVLQGATLRVFTAVGDQFDTIYDLPASKWTYLGSAGSSTGYRFATAPNDPSPIRTVVLKGRVGIRVAGEGPGLGHSLGSDPCPVKVVLLIGSTKYCATFGGTARFTPTKTFTARGGIAVSECP